MEAEAGSIGGCGAILVVERGASPGISFPLVSEKTLIGRGRNEAGKIAFDNPIISRSHAEIIYSEGTFSIRDLGSTNGTQVNGSPLDKDVLHTLSTNDRIDLARGAILLCFRQSLQTVQLENPLEFLIDPPLRVDESARDVWLHETRLDPPLSFRDFEVLRVLWRNREKACSKDDLAAAWGEEFVSDEQIEQSIYRIRKRMEASTSQPNYILTVRGYGYKLSFPTQQQPG